MINEWFKGVDQKTLKKLVNNLCQKRPLIKDFTSFWFKSKVLGFLEHSKLFNHYNDGRNDGYVMNQIESKSVFDYHFNHKGEVLDYNPTSHYISIVFYLRPEDHDESKIVFSVTLRKPRFVKKVKQGFFQTKELYDLDMVSFTLNPLEDYKQNKLFKQDFYNSEKVKPYVNSLSDNEKQVFQELIEKVRSIYKKELDDILKEQNDLQSDLDNIFKKFDKDSNGVIDLIEDNNEFNLLLKKHQKSIIEKGKEFNQNYTHQFIKVGNYIKQKRNNLQLIFDCVKQVQNQKDLGEYVEILEGEIHSYNLLLINSLNLIVSLIEDDQITFYDIYEKLDKLNIYNSNWENEISQKLTTINKGISELNSNIREVMYEVRDMGNKIVSSIEDLSYITQETSKMLDNRLVEIDSSIKTNNLLTLINTYQTYQINKNTKPLR